MTVLEVIQRSTEFLIRKGVESPRLQSELLLAHVLKVPRMKLYLAFDQSVPIEAEASMRSLVQRRGTREPLQHLTGTTCFLGIDLETTKAALIPRPETEVLAERARQEMQKASPESPLEAIDFGTGSGCLAIALALQSPYCLVHAIDSSEDALALSQKNAQRHQVTEQIRFYHGDGFSPLPKNLLVDLMVSNPPYIPTTEIAELQPEVRQYDPRLALDGGEDGLNFFRLLATEGTRFLKPGKMLMTEFGDGQEVEVSKKFSGERWEIQELIKDLTGRPRILVARKR